MLIVTSLSPGHTNSENQLAALSSWQQYGECISLNSEHEIEKLQSLYEGVTFVKTQRTVQELIGKPLVSINAMIDYAKERNEDLFLINSDIVLASKLPELKQDGITIFSRYDYSDSMANTTMFIWGFDVFHIPVQFLNIFPPSIYALGMAWHDLWSSYRVALSGIPLYYPKGEYAFHKLHPTQYNFNEWNYVSEYVKWEFNFDKKLNGGQVATMMMETIKSKLIYI